MSVFGGIDSLSFRKYATCDDVRAEGMVEMGRYPIDQKWVDARYAQ